MKELKNLTLDQLLGMLTSYEMIILNGNPTPKASAFKVDKKPMEEHDDSCCDLDEEEVNFMRKLKWGSRNYKDKLPFKSCSCGKVGHYASKCPKKKKKNKEYDPRKKFRKVQQERMKAKKRSLYTQGANSSKSEDSQFFDQDKDDESKK